MNLFNSLRNNRLVSTLVLLLLVAAIPLTVFVAQQQQETRQRAAQIIQTSCSVSGNAIVNQPFTISSQISGAEGTPYYTWGISSTGCTPTYQPYSVLNSPTFTTTCNEIGVKTVSITVGTQQAQIGNANCTVNVVQEPIPFNDPEANCTSSYGYLPRVYLSWSDVEDENANTPEYYKVWRTGGGEGWVIRATLLGNRTHFNDSSFSSPNNSTTGDQTVLGGTAGLQENTTYTYQIEVGKPGGSIYSLEKSETTPANCGPTLTVHWNPADACTEPDKPVVFVGWQEANTGSPRTPEYYKIYRSGGGSDNVFRASLQNNRTHFNDSSFFSSSDSTSGDQKVIGGSPGLQQNTQYTYWLEVEDQDPLTPLRTSNRVTGISATCAVPPTAPPIPTLQASCTLQTNPAYTNSPLTISSQVSNNTSNVYNRRNVLLPTDCSPFSQSYSHINSPTFTTTCSSPGEKRIKLEVGTSNQSSEAYCNFTVATPPRQYLPEDIDENSYVNLTDYELWARAYRDNRTNGRENINRDNSTDLVDFNLWLKKFRELYGNGGLYY